MQLRRFTSHDIPVIVDNVVAFQREHTRFNDPYFGGIEPERIMRVLQSNINSSLFHCNVIEHEGVLVAGLAATLHQYGFNREVFADDLFLYVKPEHRKGSVFEMLLNAYEEWARTRQAREVRITFTTGTVNLDLIGRWIGKKGYDEVGRIWSKRTQA